MPKAIYSIEMLEIAQIRSLVWESLTSKWGKGATNSHVNYSSPCSTICEAVTQLAVEKRMAPNPIRTEGSYVVEITFKSRALIVEILWELVVQGILYLENPAKEIYNITEYGLKVLEAEKPIPHDPDGYLKHLKTEVPDIDDVIFTYISEAVNAYNHRLYLSATTDIGCASERAFLLLIEAYTNFLPSQKEQEAFRKRTNGKFVKTQFEEFQRSFGGQKGRIDKELLDGIEIVLNGVFELLRQNRNSTGHPTGKAMERESVFVSLQVFATYCKRIYALIHYFQVNAVDFGNN